VTDIQPSTGAGQKIAAAELAWYQPLIEPSDDLRTLLKPMLQTYKLSATHLNNFLDVSNGGPRQFLLDNLLHFPSTKSASASYGSAIHKALQQAHVHLSATGERKPLEDVLRDFEVALKQERLSILDFETYVQKGSEQLQAFLDQKYDSFTPTQKVELNFAGQEVVVGDARLSGMLDLVDVDPEARTMIVTDYKTGKPAQSWKASTEHEKVKLYKYRQQLLFYKLLVENSRDYGKFTVGQGCLQFVEPTQAGTITSLELEFDKEELERLRSLILKVWDRIISLDLPDTSSYDSSIKGILAFEDDLLNDRI
jgi:DNA helicase-2/ATP-dependent DNA helicase PcrA